MNILDTNVVSELMKPSPSAAVISWISAQAEDDLFTTTITVAETFYGIELLPTGKRRDQLFRRAEDTFSQDFAGRILTFDEPSARLFGVIAANRRTQGRPISTFDGQIAAIARTHGASLATRDTDDFEGCGVQLINPWQ